jgi:hypothetical protein
MDAKVPKHCGIGKLYVERNPPPKPDLSRPFGKVPLPPASGLKKRSAPSPKAAKPAAR